MPFGLANAPSTFQAYINKAMAGYVDSFCIMYLDDILIFSNLLEEYREHVAKVLECLWQFQLYANLQKCQFYTALVPFLRYIISTNGVSIDPCRVESIAKWPWPKSFWEVQVFLSFANFYYCFIYQYSRIATPLSALLKGIEKGVKTGLFIWTDDAETAFCRLHKAFTTAPILRHFDPFLHIRVEIDASRYAVAGILNQLHAGSQ